MSRGRRETFKRARAVHLWNCSRNCLNNVSAVAGLANFADELGNREAKVGRHSTGFDQVSSTAGAQRRT